MAQAWAAGMKQILVMIAVALVGQSVLAADEKALIADPIVEKAVRASIKKPTGELTKTDLGKVTYFYLAFTKITDAGLKDVAKLQKLTYLGLGYTQITGAGLKELAKLKNLKNLEHLDLFLLATTYVTKADVAELQKALPKCKIDHNAEK